MRPRAVRRLGRLLLVAVVSVAGLAARLPVPLDAAVASAAQLPKQATLYMARAYFTSLAQRDQLAGELDAQETSTAGGYVTAIVSEAQLQALAAQGYRVVVDQGQTDLLNHPLLRLQSQAGGIAGFPCYRTVEETYASLSALAANHPGLATWHSVGQSWLKVTSGGSAGFDLNVLEITNKARPGPKPTFFLMAAIHAREYSTAELATRFAEYLVAQYGHDPDVTWLLDNFKVVVMPQANPDGRVLAEQGIYQRKNVNNTNGGNCSADISNQFGTDLNRNSTYQWGPVGSSTNPCDQVYHGPTAASEPETQAIQAEMAALFPPQRGPALTDTVPTPALATAAIAGASVTASGVFITLHSYGELDLFPWGFTSDPAPNGTALQTLGRKFGYYNHYSVCQAPVVGCLYSTSGTTDDWAYGQLGVASYTIELGTWFFEPCDNFDNSIWPDNLPALLYAFKAARLPYISPAGPETVQVAASPVAVRPGVPFTLTALADDTRFASGGWGDQPPHNIVAARYSVDSPSWITGTTVYSLTAAGGVFDAPAESVRAVVNTTGWTPGNHLILVESEDAAGNWGVPSAAFVDIIGPLDHHAYFPVTGQ